MWVCVCVYMWAHVCVVHVCIGACVGACVGACAWVLVRLCVCVRV